MRHIKNPLHRANAQAQREFNFIAGGRKYLVRLNLLYAYVDQADIELVQGYRPDAWNPYPAIKPTVSGFYLLTVKLKDQPNVKPFVTVGCLDPFGYWEKYTDSEVLAFRELPEAYEKEKEK